MPQTWGGSRQLCWNTFSNRPRLRAGFCHSWAHARGRHRDLV